MSVSIILPCYKPPENWANNIITNYFQLKEIISEEIEIIVIQDGICNGVNDSDIKKISESISNFKFIKYEINKGKGYAIRQGVTISTDDIIIYTDIDFPYTINSILNVYKSLKEGKYDIAVGVKNQSYYMQVPFSRRIISKGFRKLIRFFLSIPTTDTQCGLKGFVKEIKPAFLKTTIDRYLFDLEFIRNSYKSGYKIITIPIDLNENVHFRVLNYRILLPEMFNFIKLLLK